MSASFTLRTLRRRPGVAIASILSLAIGIGAATSIFGIVNSALLRPLPWPSPESVVAVVNHWDDQDRGRISPAEAFDYEEQLKTVSHFGVYAAGEANVTGGNAPERLRAAYLSAGVLPALGVPPVAGRFFTSEEDLPGRNDVAVLAHATWQSRFGGRSDAIGSKILVDGEAATIVGVMPPHFRLPLDLVENEESALYLPLALDPAERSARGSHFLVGVARLRPNVAVTEGSADVSRVAASFGAAFPDDYPPAMRFAASMQPLRDEIYGDVRPLLLLLLASVCLLVLIACANVANLMLVSADARRRDTAVRAAIGAERRHLLAQFVGESVAIVVPGALAGLGLAFLVTRFVPRFLPPDVPSPGVITLDGRVLAFTMGVAALCALVTTVLPLLQARDIDPQDVLREEGRSSTGGRKRARFRAVLVAAEMALAVVLSLGAGLLLRSMAHLLAVDPGFNTEGVLTMQVTLPAARYPDDARIVEAVRLLREELGGIRGVTAAAAVTNLPLGSRLGDLNLEIEGRPKAPDEPSRRADWQVVTPGYFETLGMTLVRGRGIEPSDRAGAPGVVVINESLARQYWSGTEAIGTRFRLGGGAGPGLVTIVGIVRDIRHAGLSEEARPEMYLAHQQFTFWNGGDAVRSMVFALRTERNPGDVIAEAREILRNIDPDLPLAGVRTLSSVRAASVARPRFLAALFSAFSILAVLMAALGVYGLLAFLVAQRTREIGIRMALGAGTTSVMRLVLREALRMVVPGLLLGAVVALLLARLLASQLYAVRPQDPATFATVVGALLLVAMAASAIPALRAARVEPTEALRQD